MYKIQGSMARAQEAVNKIARKRMRSVIKRCFSERGVPIDPRAMPGLHPDGSATPEAIQSLNDRLENQYPMPQMPREVDSKLGDMKFFHHDGTQTIQEFSHDWIKVSGNTYHHSVIVMPTFTVLWRPRRLMDINADSLMLPLLFHPKIRHVFIGIGTAMRDRPPPIRGLVERGLTYEHMTTPAAMNCFNNSATTGGTKDMACAILLPVLRDEEKEEIYEGFVPKWRIDEIRRLRAGIDDKHDLKISFRRRADEEDAGAKNERGQPPPMDFHPSDIRNMGQW